MLASAEVILLDVYDLHENDRIVSMLSARHGKVRGVARGARRKYSRFAGTLQPLAKAKVTWYLKEGNDLARISGVDLIRPAHRMQSDLEGILLGGYLAGHVLEFAQENDPSDRLFRLLDSTVAALLEGVDRSLAARYFETWALRLAGIFPPPSECPECRRPLADGARLSSAGDALVCKDCGSGRQISAATVEFLLRIGRQALPAVAADPPGPSVLGEVEELASTIRRSFLQHELKSYRVMQETLCTPSKT